MDPSKDYYKEMGLGESASQTDVKKAYIKLVKQYHPDQNKGTGDKFRAINEAYNVLSSPDKRKEYDSMRRPSGSSFAGSGKSSAGNSGYGADPFGQSTSTGNPYSRSYTYYGKSGSGPSSGGGRSSQQRFYENYSSQGGNQDWQKTGFYDERTMNRMFEEFMNKIREEEARRQASQQQTRQRQQNGWQNRDSGNNQNSQQGSPFSEWFQNGDSKQRSSTEQQREYFDNNSYYSENVYQEKMEKAKREERKRRAEEYEKFKREQEFVAREALDKTMEKVTESFNKAKEVAQKSGIVKGVVEGLSNFFKK